MPVSLMKYHFMFTKGRRCSGLQGRGGKREGGGGGGWRMGRKRRIDSSAFPKHARLMTCLCLPTGHSESPSGQMCCESVHVQYCLCSCWSLEGLWVMPRNPNANKHPWRVGFSLFATCAHRNSLSVLIVSNNVARV